MKLIAIALISLLALAVVSTGGLRLKGERATIAVCTHEISLLLLEKGCLAQSVFTSSLNMILTAHAMIIDNNSSDPKAMLPLAALTKANWKFVLT